jgi:hypothetical protein
MELRASAEPPLSADPLTLLEAWEMKTRVNHYAVYRSVAAAMVAGCGGQTSSSVVPVNGALNSVSGHHTFRFTGTAQIFRVPNGVTQIRVIALGGNGGGSRNHGYGGRVSAVIPVTQRENLTVFVGGDASGADGGGGGGAGGGTESYGGSGRGGGASYVEPTGTNVHMWRGWKATKNGLVVFSW